MNNKLKNIFILSLSLGFLASCGPTNPTPPKGPFTLDVPTVNVDVEGLATWNEINNASGYLYILNNKGILETTLTSLQLQDQDTLKVASKGDGVDYLTSDFSIEVKYTAPIVLDTPIVTINDNGLASWEENVNAVSYLYILNDGEEKETTTNSFQLANKDKISVAYKGDGVKYKTSSFSKPIIYNEIDETMIFDEDKIVLSFPLISDEHVGYNDTTHKNDQIFQNTLQTLKGFRPDTTFDLVVSAGDQTQNGKKVEVETLMDVYRNNFSLEDTPLFFSHGNHDTYWSGCMDTYEFFNTYGNDVYQYDLDIPMAKKGNRHMIRNDYHFIAVNFSQYMPGSNLMNDETMSWLKAKLKEASKDKSKPIFVVGHCPQMETIPGSYEYDNSGTWGGTKLLKDIFKDYPNVIYFSGHTHYNIHDDRAIYQDEVTYVQAPTTSHLELDTNMKGVTALPNARDYSFGAIVEVDENNNTRITRYDLNKKEMVMKPWEILHPMEDGSHLYKYSNEAREATKTTPTLPEKGKFTVKITSSGAMQLQFTPFVSSDYFIFSYKALIFPMSQEEVIDEKEDSLLEHDWLDDWYNSPQIKSSTIYYNLPGKYSASTTWSVKLYATDCLGNVGSAWMKEFKK